MNGRSSEREFATDSSLEGDGFELFVPLGISASPSWWSRARKPHGAPEGSFSVAGPIARIHLPPGASPSLQCTGRPRAKSPALSRDSAHRWGRETGWADRKPALSGVFSLTGFDAVPPWGSADHVQ